MKLNMTKCVFRVTKGKPLGYVVSSKGIQVDPTKVQDILVFPAPTNEKENSRVFEKIAIHQSIYLSDHTNCEPIFKLLRKPLLRHGTRNANKPSIK